MATRKVEVQSRGGVRVLELRPKGRVIVVQPDQEPTVIEHDGPVELEHLRHWLGSDIVFDRVGLGTIPPEGRLVDLWCDDNGLLKEDVRANRLLPNNTAIFGAFVLCALSDVGESLPLTEEEATFLLEDVRKRWRLLPADFPRPDPSWEVTSW